MEFHSLIHIRNNICSWLMRQSLMHESDLVGNEDRFETILHFFLSLSIQITDRSKIEGLSGK